MALRHAKDLENLGKMYSTTKNKCRNWLPIGHQKIRQNCRVFVSWSVETCHQDADFLGGRVWILVDISGLYTTFDSGGWTFFLIQVPKVSGCTLSETNIAMEHPAFCMVFTRIYWGFSWAMSVSVREGNWRNISYKSMDPILVTMSGGSEKNSAR